MRFTSHALLFALTSTTAFAIPPLLEKLEPIGGQRGTAVKLTLVGKGLTDRTQVISKIPAALTPLSPPREMDLQGKELPYLLEINADAAVGVYPVRIQTQEGLSNVLLFSVGAFPEAADKEIEAVGLDVGEPLNDDPETAQAVTTPVTINGALPGPDRDFYRFSAKAGQSLVLEVESRRIGSAIDPAIELFDVSGKRLAWNQDAPGIGVDARLDHKFAKDGEYLVAVRDSRFSEQKQDFYRLKIGQYAYAEGVFPLGWKRGETIDVELFGGNLAKPVKVRANLTTEDSVAEFTYVNLPGEAGVLPMRLALGEDSEVIEPESAGVRELESGTVVNGRISKPGETDSYKFGVKEGEKWHIQLQAARLGTSNLYGVLTLFDGKGETLGTTREIGVRYKLSNLDVAEDPNADQHMSFEVPEGVDEIRIEVEDLLGRGGDLYAYRLVAKQQPADFSLTILTQQVSVPLRGSALVTVRSDRQGYKGPIKLSIPNLPDDIIMNGGHIPFHEHQGSSLAASTGFLTLTPKPGAEPQTLNLEIWGEAEVDGKLIRRRARGPGIQANVSFRIGERTVTDNVAPWLGSDLPAVVVKEQPAVVELMVPHYIKLIQGTKTEIPWQFTPRSRGLAMADKAQRTSLISTPNVRVTRRLERDPKNPDKGVFVLGSQIGWGPGKFEVVLPAKIKVDGREETIYSPAITIDVVRAYEVEPAEEVTTLEPGGTTELVARLRREEGFDREVEVKAENLPLGVACETAKVPGTDNEFRLPCTVEADAAGGEFEIDLATSSTVIGGEDKEIPFSPPPFKAKVKIAGGELRASR